MAAKAVRSISNRKSTTNIVEIWGGTVVPTESVSSDFIPNEAHSSVTLSLGPVSSIVRALETMYSESAKVAACSGSPASRPTPDLVTNPLANTLGLVKQTLARFINPLVSGNGSVKQT